MSESDDTFWLAYSHDFDDEPTQYLKVLFDGFGFEEYKENFDEHPKFAKFVKLVKQLAIDVWELQKE